MPRNKLMIKLIHKYQQNKAIIGTGHCKFYPSCSNYAIEAYQKFNFFYASILVTIRIISCNPLAHRRYYPVPLSHFEKYQQKIIRLCQQKVATDFIDMIITQSKLMPFMQTSDYLVLINEYHNQEIIIPKYNTYQGLTFLGSKNIRVGYDYIDYFITNKNKNDEKIDFNADDYINVLCLLQKTKLITGFNPQLDYDVRNAKHSSIYLSNTSDQYALIPLSSTKLIDWLKILYTKYENNDLVIIGINCENSDVDYIKNTIVSNFNAFVILTSDFVNKKNAKLNTKLICKWYLEPLIRDNGYYEYRKKLAFKDALFTTCSSNFVFIVGPNSCHKHLNFYYNELIFITENHHTEDQKYASLVLPNTIINNLD